MKNSSNFSTDNLFIYDKGGGGRRLDFKDKSSRKCSLMIVLELEIKRRLTYHFTGV